MPMGREGEVEALGGNAVSSGYVNVGGGGGMLSGKRDCPEADNGAAVPVRRVAGREVELRVGNGTRMEARVALNVGTGRRSDRGNAPTVAVAKMVTFGVGEGRKPVIE